MSFDPSQYTDFGKRELLKPGSYKAFIPKSDVRENSKGTGEYLLLSFEIFDGPYKGREIPVFLNLWNRSSESVRIAREELAEICRCCHASGIQEERHPTELYERPIVIVVVVKTRKDTGDKVNEITMYYSKEAYEAATRPAHEARNPDEPAQQPAITHTEETVSDPSKPIDMFRSTRTALHNDTKKW